MSLNQEGKYWNLYLISTICYKGILNVKKLSLKTAKEKGLTRYYTGNTCKNGHKSLRHVSSRRCIACDLERKKTNHYKSAERVRRYKRRRDKNFWPIFLLENAKRRAKIRGLDFDISVDDIIIDEVCPILKTPYKIGEEVVCYESPSLDRIDSSKGYIKGNVQVISYRANTIKCNSTIEELEMLLQYLKMCNR